MGMATTFLFMNHDCAGLALQAESRFSAIGSFQQYGD
jgi:hypothetical protein